MANAREKTPINSAAFRYSQAADWPRVSSVLVQSAWSRGSLLVTSSLADSELFGGLVCHLGISKKRSPPTDEECQRVLADFDAVGAGELALPEVAGRARHFEIASDAILQPKPYCLRCVSLPWQVGELDQQWVARIRCGDVHHPRCPARAN